MKDKVFACVLAGTGLFSASLAHAQSTAAASQTMQISAWGGLTGTYTGLNEGRNLGITAGADVTLRARYFGLSPTVEIRGTYPIAAGHVDEQRDILAGIKLSKTYFGVLHPYANFLIGRGQINYNGPNGLGFLAPSGQFYYQQTTSTVFSPGVGLDLSLTDHLSLKGDLQLQHWDTPAATSGHLYAKPLTAGVVYRFNFNRHPKRPRD